MSLSNLKNNETKSSPERASSLGLTPVRVFSVILDNTHPKYTGEDSIGTIFYGKVDNNESSLNLEALNRARPLFSFIRQYPLQNEIVLILNTTSRNIYGSIGGDNAFISTYYLPNINIWNNSHHNALPIEGALRSSANSQESSIGIQQNNVESNKIKLGEYFKENPNIKNIQPFEGDTIIEGRFGNSIRFGSSNPRGKNNWSNNESEGDPITIIANGQPQVSGDTILEDINNIDSSIFMLSNQNIDNFVPASLNLQSLGKQIAPTPNTQILIVDTPDPPIKPAPEPITPEPVFTEPIIEEKPQTISPPTEQEVEPQGIIDDPIFALLDEAKAEGELDFTETSVFDIAGTEADEGDENPVDFSPENPPDWVEKNREVVENIPTPSPSPVTSTVATRGSTSLRNKVGNVLIIPPPDPNLTVVATNRRDIRYIFLHTAASSTKSTPTSLMEFFFRPDDPTKEGLQGRGWEYGGYHWIIEQNGDATRIYNDSVITNGVGGFNGNSIHLNWVGGASSFNMTQRQAYTMSRLTKKYLKAYPNAKVVGHNQYTVKECPWFHVPTFAKNIGVDSNQIDYSDMNEIPKRYDKETGKLISIGLSLDEAIRNANQISNGI